MSFFVVAGTVKPIRVSPVKLVDYLLGKTIYLNFKILLLFYNKINNRTIVGLVLITGVDNIQKVR